MIQQVHSLFVYLLLLYIFSSYNTPVHFLSSSTPPVLFSSYTAPHLFSSYSTPMHFFIQLLLLPFCYCLGGSVFIAMGLGEERRRYRRGNTTEKSKERRAYKGYARETNWGVKVDRRNMEEGRSISPTSSSSSHQE